jgi:Ca2+-binding EF-hand superfamily protein
MHRHDPILGAAAVALLLGAALAQAPVPTAGLDPISASTYSEARSRSLFFVVDGNADDRIDLFEAAAALGTIASPKDVVSFRRLDVDRDGFLQWREFDRHFRSVVQHGESLRIIPARPWSSALEDRLQPLAETPVRAAFLLFDADRTGGLSRDEIRAMVERMQLPVALATRFLALDRDRSGEVSLGELEPWAIVLPNFAAGPVSPPSGSALLLPPPFQGADENQDGRLDLDEIRIALRRLEPSLDRWVEKIIRDVDRDRDGALGYQDLIGTLPLAVGRPR